MHEGTVSILAESLCTMICWPGPGHWERWRTMKASSGKKLTLTSTTLVIVDARMVETSVSLPWMRAPQSVCLPSSPSRAAPPSCVPRLLSCPTVLLVPPLEANAYKMRMLFAEVGNIDRNQNCNCASTNKLECMNACWHFELLSKSSLNSKIHAPATCAAGLDIAPASHQ